MTPLTLIDELGPLALHDGSAAAEPTSVPSFEFVAVGRYETEGSEYRLYRIPDLWPPVWNLERGTEMIIAGAATKHDALVLFGHWYAQRGTSFASTLRGDNAPSRGH